MDLQIKLLMIGNSSVGKAIILSRYTSDSFSPTFIPTIGIDFKIKNILLEGKRIKLQIWDTAGQERFQEVSTSYFRGAQGILLVYDITDRESFTSIKKWIQQIQLHCVNIKIIMIGHLFDGSSFETCNRIVSFEEGSALANLYNLNFVEVDSVHDINVDIAFSTLTRAIVHREEISRQDFPGRFEIEGFTLQSFVEPSSLPRTRFFIVKVNLASASTSLLLHKTFADFRDLHLNSPSLSGFSFPQEHHRFPIVGRIFGHSTPESHLQSFREMLSILKQSPFILQEEDYTALGGFLLEAVGCVSKIRQLIFTLKTKMGVGFANIEQFIFK